MKESLLLILILWIGAGCANSNSDKKGIHRSDNQIQSINFTVVKTFPHDTDSFTEGLIFHDNQLFESTGSPEEYPKTRSVIGIVDLKTGKIDVKIELDRNSYFGEGIVFFKDRIYQLTYKNQTGFIYDSETYKKVGFFTYLNKEG
jgi:glutamine cyclotransferase